MIKGKRLLKSHRQHTDFSESTEEVKPLTEEEKKAKLEELRSKLANKRAGRSEQDKEDKKRNEVRIVCELCWKYVYERLK